MTTESLDASAVTPVSRRRFFKAAICAPALAVAGTAPAAPRPAAATTAPAQEHSSYHETQHIRTYYQLSMY